MNEVTENRVYYLDALRAVACISIIMIHASASYVMKDFGSFNFIVGNIFDSISRFGVPIFLMISGSLFLDVNYDYSKEKNKNHIIKMIKFFLFWAIFYSVLFGIVIPKFMGSKINLNYFLTELIFGHYHLWFIYMIIGFYLITPLLRVWVNDKNIHYVKCFIFLGLVFEYFAPEIIKIICYFNKNFDIYQNLLKNFGLNYVGGVTLYYILGWYLRFHEIKKKKIVYLLGIISILFEFSMTHFMSVYFNKPIQLYDNLSPHVLLQSVMMFTFFKEKVNSKKNVFLSIVAHYSLGIYAIHASIIDTLYMVLNLMNFSNALIVILTIFIISLLLSLLISIILSRFKIFKNIVS